MKPNLFLFLPYTKISYEIKAYTQINTYTYTYNPTASGIATNSIYYTYLLLAPYSSPNAPSSSWPIAPSIHQSTHRLLLSTRIAPPIIQTDKYIQVSFYMILYSFIIFILFCSLICYLLLFFYYFKM